MSPYSETNAVPATKVAVVGGGIAGLTSALALLQAKKEGANIDILVHESAVSTTVQVNLSVD